MSATTVREKRETTLPQDVAEAAGIVPGDQVDWRFENGEIRGVKVTPSNGQQRKLDVVSKNGRLMLEGELSREEILAAIRADREGK